MKKCNGVCQRICEEYYYMPDGKFLCYDCWKRGLEHAERQGKAHSQQFQEHRQIESDIEHLSEEIKSLRDKIRYEKEQAGKKNSIYPDSVECYSDPSYIPYNYAKVKSMERDLETLQNRREVLDSKQDNWHRIPPQSSQYGTTYFTNAKWVDRASAQHFESVILPRDTERRIEEERKERERRRLAQEEQQKIQAEKERENRIREEEHQRLAKKARDTERLTCLESRLLESELSSAEQLLSYDEQVFVATKSTKVDVLYHLTHIDNKTVKDAKLVIINRFENGDNIEDGLMDLMFDKDDDIRLALAKCKRKFSSSEVLQGLSVDKNKTIAQAASNNANYEEIKTGCFIATACYGDYNDYNVLELRHFRDEVLLKSRMGNSFVAFYYRHSPAIAEWLKTHTLVASTIKYCILNPIVCILRALRIHHK